MHSLRVPFLPAVAGVALTIVLASAAQSAGAASRVANGHPQDPKATALKCWQDHLQSIGWSKQLTDRHAARFLGAQTKSVANEHGGVTVTFDGSRPGMLATVTVATDGAGNVVGKPVVVLADVLEAR